MKRTIIVMMILVNANLINAQTFDEWFKQKGTQIKYLVEQIGALKAYSEVVNKGYDIAHNGLTNVFNSKERDYSQHNSYFLSLQKVKSDIKTCRKSVFILSMKGDIERQYRLIQSFTTEFLNDKERSYVSSVYGNLVSSCNDLTDELQMTINDGQLQLKDDERIQRIDKIYLDMQDRYQFSQSFANEIRLLAIGRLSAGKDVTRSLFLYGIK